MRWPSAVACLFCTLLAWSTGVLAERHALLIGVGRYTNLEPALQLHGPAHDVANMQQALLRLGWQPERIRRLVDSEGTRAAIVAAFRALANRVMPGDLAMIYLAGHGTQSPARMGTGLRDEEPDFLDELFLPTDAGGWNGGIGRVDAAIYDDEFDEMITAIRRRGASVWLVADTCHAGTITRARSEDGYTTRSVPPSAVGIPPEVFRSAVEHLAPGKGARLVRPPLDLEPGTGSLTAFFASDAAGEATETDFPDPARGKVRMGLFTRTLVKVLADTTPSDTYQAILARVRERLPATGRQSMPQLAARDSAVPFLDATPVQAVGPVPPAILRIFDAIGDGKTMQFLGRQAAPHKVELKPATRETADLTLHLCDGHPTLAPRDSPACDATARQSLVVNQAPQEVGEYLCRAAYAIQLNTMSREDTLSRERIDFGFNIEGATGWTGEPRLRNGDRLKPYLRVGPGAPPVQFAVYFVDGRGQAILVRSSAEDPPQLPAGKGTSYAIAPLHVSTGPEKALGREKLLMVVVEASPQRPAWTWAPPCGAGDDKGRLLPTGRLAVKRQTWITVPTDGRHRPGT